MSKLLHTVSLFLLSLLLTLTGCGDPVVDPGYKGEPLLTVSGQLRATPDYESKGPLHVALVWFPKSLLESEDGAEVPDLFMTVAEDVAISGSFPLDYHFDVFQPPPPEALGAWGQGMPGKGAFGLLVAYEDLNRNGKLDRISRNGTPKDRVIGSSLYESTRPYMVVYTDTAQQGVPAGFSLAGTGENDEIVTVPTSTSLMLTLTAGGDLYDALVCEEGPLTFMLAPVCGLGEGEPLPPPSSSKLGVSGDVKLKDGHLEVQLQAYLSGDGIQQLEDAEVKLGGRTLLFDSTRKAYVLSEDASTLLTPGEPVRLDVSARGDSTFRMLPVPGTFSITAPGAGQEVSNAAPVTMQWTAAEHATNYRVELDSSSFNFSFDAPEGALAYTFQTGSTGPAAVRVEAIADFQPDFEPFWISVAVVQEQAFVFVP